MGPSLCRAPRHPPAGDEPGMAPQAGSAVSQIPDPAGIARGKAMTRHPVRLFYAGAIDAILSRISQRVADSVTVGGVAEWSKAHAWSACMR